MDAAQSDATEDLAEFVRSHILAGDWFKSRGALPEAIDDIRVGGFERDEIGGYRIVRYRCDLLVHHDSGARMETLNARMRLPLDSLNVEYDLVVSEDTEELVTDVPDIADIMDIVID